MAYPATLAVEYKTAYETGATQIYPVGQKGTTPDGSIYRYCLMGSTIGVANKTYQGAATAVANWTTQAHTVALAVGDTEISFKDGGTAFTADQLAGGTILVQETDDLGHIYRVKSNIATAANETVCQLEDGVTVKVAVAVAGGNVLTANLSPWREIIITPLTTPTNMVVGIPRVIIAASAFGWVQSRGVASCLVSGAPLPGNIVIPGGAAGSAGIAAGQTTNATVYYGRMLNLGIDGDFGALFLTLE